MTPLIIGVLVVSVIAITVFALAAALLVYTRTLAGTAVSPTLSLPGAGAARSSVQDLIAAYDVAIDEADRTQITADLAAAGVVSLTAIEGEAFDPSTQRAVATMPTTDAFEDGEVALLHRPGWKDQAGIIRYTEVSVYRYIGE
ncbi:nucleotide exchange factor GrpE [Hoyosella rhizosphaerae]|uniref:GrpE protein n=1 Tax=Hoyosella rhizosphaerae TaxID=1755582 RepID=A0A916UER6_9ACTN|nr:nucleotide exchange factor GrpE [Hoyosella rhizosphaerae]MBN4925546.1 nucleotide exchange factor GrpE [Hoyosella rhizosphaerae]GGC69818.1 hypothetical protein GCM10011410_23300 [Hoyosella rhizosphaerae]